MVFTDQVSHAALAGHFALEQTFYLPVSAMVTPDTAPLRVLERLTGRVWPDTTAMDSIFKGDLSTTRGRTVAWIDSLFIDHALFRLVWSNLAAGRPWPHLPLQPSHATAPGSPDPRVGLKTLINLRGKTLSGSDALSREAAGSSVWNSMTWRLKAAARPTATVSCGCTASGSRCRRRRSCTASQAPTGRDWWPG